MFVFEIANNKTMAKHSQSMSSKYPKMSWYFATFLCVGVKRANARKCMNDLAKLLMLMYIYMVMLNENVRINIKLIWVTDGT